MDQRLTFVTLGVNDLAAMTKFYTEQFGWIPMKKVDSIVFFKLNGTILGLFPASDLAADIGIVNDGSGFKRFTLAVNYATEQDVDVVFDRLSQNGVRIVKSPEKVFWGGYSGYVADIENNYWEIACNPFLEMDEDGNAVRHK